jgi:hypothetical protein
LEGKCTAVQLIGLTNIQGKAISAIADSGSSITAVSYQAAREGKAQITILPTPLKALLANGKDALLTNL